MITNEILLKEGFKPYIFAGKQWEKDLGSSRRLIKRGGKLFFIENYWKSFVLPSARDNQKVFLKTLWEKSKHYELRGLTESEFKSLVKTLNIE